MKLAEFKEKYIGDRAFYKRYLYLALLHDCTECDHESRQLSG